MNGILSFGLAYQHIRAALGRNVLSVLAVALGVALAVAVHLMNGAVMDGFVEAIDDVAGRAALSVGAGEGLSFDEGVVETLKNVPGIEHAAPLVTGVAFPDDGSGELLSVYGIDVGDDAAVRLYHRGDTGEIIDDLLQFLNSKNAVIVGRELASRRGLVVGSPFDLVTPRGRQQFVVRGILNPEGLARTLGGRLIVMDIYAAQLAFNGEGRINQVDLVVPRGEEDVVKAAVQAQLPAGLTVSDPSIRKNVIQKTVRGVQALLSAFAALTVLAGFVICYSHLASVFQARVWEIGLMRAVGLRRSVVFLELLKESSLLGLAGTAVGVALGLLIARLALPAVVTFAALQSRLAVPATAVAPDIWTVLLGAVVGIGAATLAAVVPALGIARRQPVAALSLRGREASPGSVRVHWVRAGFALGASVVLIWLQKQTGVTALGYLTTAVIAVAACLIAPLVARLGGRIITWLMSILIGPAAGFEVGPVARQPQRTALTTATLGLGLGAILMFSIVAWSLERTLATKLTAMFAADLYVTSAFDSDGWMSAPISPALLGELGDVPGVDLVSSEQRESVNVRDGNAVLVAHDPSSFTDSRVCRWSLERGALPDALGRVARGEAALVSSTFARRFDVQAGDLVTLPSPTGPQTVLVTGVVGAEPTIAVIISRVRYRAAWNDEKVRWARVVVAEGASATDVSAEIARRLGTKYRLQIRSLPELVGHFTGQVRQAFGFLYLMEIMTFTLIVIAIGDTLATSVLERKREFGMMRAVGLRRSQLSRMVVLEGATLGLIGLGLAAAFGLGLGLFWVEVQFPALLGWDLDLHFPYRFAGTAGVLTVVLCVMGAVFPSIHAARLEVTQALRSE